MRPIRMAKRSRTRTMTRTKRRSRRRNGRRYSRVRRSFAPYSIARWLTTSQYFTLNAGAASIEEYQLYLNSAYDPFGTLSASKQPLGFDQYCPGLYQRYTVVGWRVHIEAVSSDNTNPIKLGFTPTRAVTALASWEHYNECPGTVQRVLTPDQDKIILSSRGGVKKWLAPPGAKMLSVEELSGTSTTNPSRVLFGHVYCSALDNTSDAGAVQISVTLRQLVVFHEPVVPSRSTQ